MRSTILGVILLTSAANAQQRVTGGGTPYASPDGRHIAFVSNRDGTSDLYLVNADGSGLRRLTSDSSYESIAGWVGTSPEVVFTTMSPQRPNPGQPLSSPVRAVSINGQVRSIGTIPGRGAGVSPDGKTIAYSGGTMMSPSLVLSAIDGTQPRVVRDSTQGAAFNFAYAPDGGSIAYTQMTLAQPRELSIWLMSADGSGARQVGTIAETEGSPQWPAWSPDGKRLAIQVGKYDRNDPTKNLAHIWVLDVASGQGTKLNAHDTPYLDETPTWLDNATIAFQSDRTGRMEIWAMSADGRNARQLTR
jgi:Tol biopolymer transport system component